jgi:hypothetical protein
MEIVMLIAGLIFAGLGGFMYYDHAQFVSTSHPSKGTVVGVRTKRGSKGGEMYAPVVGYLYEGAEQEFTSGVYSSSLSLAIGDSVDILVSNRDPSKARLLNSPVKILSMIFILIGLGCSIGFFFIFDFTLFSMGVAAVITLAIVIQAFFKLRSHHIYSFSELMEVVAEAREGKGGAAFTGRSKKSRSSTRTSGSRDSLITDQTTLKKHRAKSEMPPWLAWLMIVLAVAAFVGGGYLIQSKSEFLASAQLTHGVVVSLKSETSSSSNGGTSTVYYPIVRYTPPGGTEIEFKHNMGSSSPSFHRGEQVPVLYLRENPREAFIDEGWMNWLGPVIPLIFGVVFSLVGFMALKKQAKRKREQETTENSLRLDI